MNVPAGTGSAVLIRFGSLGMKKLPGLISQDLKQAYIEVALAVALTLGSSSALAQSASGSIYGTADAGTTVTIKSQETGLTRELKVGADGKFNFTALPTGTYTVTESEGGAEVASQNARVNAGIGTAVTFGVDASEEVVVLGVAASPIDTSTAQVSTTYSASQLSQLPVAQSPLDVALLAPGVIRGTSGANNPTSPGDEDYTKSASFGGASVAENQYYINGFNVTNLFRNLQYADLPFEAIDSEQVVTGGYGPEYGLSTGGVVNITTKKGSNDWKVGVGATWTPDSLRATAGPTTYTSDGSAYHDYSKDTHSSTKYNLWASGAIVPDKLFVYAVAEFTKQSDLTYPNSYYADRNVWDQDTKSPFGLVKIDWNINDKNIVELTGISNQTKYETAEYSDDFDDAGFVTKGAYTGTDVVKRGGWIGVAKYTSYITDNLTASAQYGQLKSKREEYQDTPYGKITYDGTLGDGTIGQSLAGCPYVSYDPAWSSVNSGVATPTCYTSEFVNAATGEDTRKAGRVDFEYKVPGTFLGTHDLKAGFDQDKWNTFSGQTYSGGVRYRYRYSASLGNYVREYIFQTGANAAVDSDAYYLKDDWQITKNFLIQLGVRNDSFKNKNGAGETYLRQDDIWQPRLGFAWDVKGDSSRKLYGSYGIYSLPVTAGVSVRGASASYYCYQNYNYTGIDSTTGAPVLGSALGDVACFNGEDGTVPAAGSFAATDLKPTKQEEFIVGFQQDLGSEWKGGVRATYRNLLQTIDDFCDPTAFDNWKTRTGSSLSTDNVDSNAPCFVVNPGSGATIRYDIDGNGTLDTVHLTAADIGLPKAVRKYLGFEFTLEKAWSRLWYTQLSYTWAHNWGNAEGLADSDIEQLDIGTTEAFDFPAIMEGTSGNLPNDHRHTFKGLVAFKPFSEWTFSGNLSVQTGKPINCIGYDADADANFGYGAVYHYCDGKTVPRGSVGTTDTIVNVDAGVVYSPNAVPGLSAMISIYNLFNSHGVTNVDEFYEDSNSNKLSSYLTAYSYQDPRYVQLSAKYQFDFARH